MSIEKISHNIIWKRVKLQRTNVNEISFSFSFNLLENRNRVSQ